MSLEKTYVLGAFFAVLVAGTTSAHAKGPFSTPQWDYSSLSTGQLWKLELRLTKDQPGCAIASITSGDGSDWSKALMYYLAPGKMLGDTYASEGNRLSEATGGGSVNSTADSGTSSDAGWCITENAELDAVNAEIENRMGIAPYVADADVFRAKVLNSAQNLANRAENWVKTSVAHAAQ